MAEFSMPGCDAAARIAAFELRLQTRSPVFLIVVGTAALMVVGSLTVERLQVGPLRTGNRTSAEAVLHVHLVWSLFFLFTAAAFAADAALRDETAHAGEIVRSTPVSLAALAAGRFGGALAAVLLSFLSVPAALVLAPFAPWANSLALPHLAALAYGSLILAGPNLVLATAVFYALAAIARSAMAAYLGAVALLVLYGLGSTGTGGSTFTSALSDPFGFAAVRFATTGWSAFERAVTLPPLTGALGLNRLVWLGVAAGATMSALRYRSHPTRSVRPAAAAIGPAPISRPLPIALRFDSGTAATQFASRTRLELGQVLGGPFLPLLLLLGLASVAGALSQLPSDAAHADALARVDEAFRLVPIVVATFWAGELIWGEHDVGLDEIVGSCPVSTAALVLPKLLTLLLILGGSLSTTALAAAGLEAWRTGEAHTGFWLLGFALPRTWDAGLLAILAVFLQAIAPGKLAGLGLMVLYLISALALETMGLTGDLYRYGGSTAMLDLSRVASTHALLVRAYWGTAALLLIFLAQKLATRGVPEHLGLRLRRAVRESRRADTLQVLALATAMVLLGVVLLMSGDAGC